MVFLTISRGSCSDDFLNSSCFLSMTLPIVYNHKISNQTILYNSTPFRISEISCLYKIHKRCFGFDNETKCGKTIFKPIFFNHSYICSQYHVFRNWANWKPDSLAISFLKTFDHSLCVGYLNLILHNEKYIHVHVYEVYGFW